MRKSGVYCITCLANKKSYVGSSYNVNYRWTDHKRQLRNGKHHSAKLQRAWNKYGEAQFVLSLIEEVEDRSLLEPTEQKWIDKLNTYKTGLNCSQFSNEADRWNNFKEKRCKECIITFPDGHEESIKGIREFCLKHNLNQGAMNRISLYQLNHYKGFHCRAANVSMCEWNTKRDNYIKLRPPKKTPSKKRQGGKWQIINPDGVSVVVDSLTHFCEEHNLSQGNMTEVAFGKRHMHKGYRCKYLSQITQTPQED